MSAQAQDRSPPFEPGQRAPDFLLQNPQGKLGRFYDRFLGNLVVLFFAPSYAAPGALAELLAFHERAEAFAGRTARIVAVSRDPAEANAALAGEHSLDFTLFSDPVGAIGRGYGTENAAGGLMSYVIDRNQRVLAAQAGGRDHAQRALAFLGEVVAAPAPGRTITAQAPVLLLPRVVEPALCTWSISAWQADHEEGEVRLRARSAQEARSEEKTRAVDYSLKKRLDHRPDEALNRALTEAVIGRIGPEVYKAFQFQIVAVERFCIGAYMAGRGDYFRPHRDNTTKQTEKRRFAVTLNLNEDYEGGGVRFPEFGEDTYRTPAGGALVFSCSLLHEAVPVTQGTRFAALSFMFGPGDVPAPPGG